MKPGFYRIMAAQFFSSLADNALFIASIALIQQLKGPSWMTPMMKWSFAASYVLLAPFVGAFADAYPKGRVMLLTNSIKIMGCLMMLLYSYLSISPIQQVYFIFLAYALVGIGAAAYSPAKYGILTELLTPEELILGNSWIEALTVLSIIFGTVLGGVLIASPVSGFMLSFDFPLIETGIDTPPEAAISAIAGIYLIAALFNLSIPDTGARYPKCARTPLQRIAKFFQCVKTLWSDKLGQVSLAVTTLFWGAGATLQLIIIEWGRSQLGLGLDEASILMGITSIGTIAGAILAGRYLSLNKALKVLPTGVVMGLVVMLMPFAYESWLVYSLLIAIGGLGGFFVVPMNALLQHRGHVLLSAGHSIAVQNFNEQLNILLMVAMYSVMLSLGMHINHIIWAFGALVSSLMLLIVYWNYLNRNTQPAS